MTASGKPALRRSRRKSGARSARQRARGAPLALGASLTIVEVRGSWRSLRALLARGQAEADARLLTTIDTAGLQLLLAAGRAARVRGLTLTLTGAQHSLLNAAAAVGLEAALREVLELA
jgi:ABC-type transporter Mla MlaB component